MYLPAFLLGRFGWPGFLVFAIPNVIGCAAFGYVLRDGETSLKFMARHATAMRWFSLVTLAYHVFFIGFACLYLLPLDVSFVWLPLVAAPVILFAGWGLSVLPYRAWPIVAVLVYVVSLLAFARVGLDPLAEIPWRGEWPGGELPWLAPTIAFGFLLCPYLDPTFHRALQHSPSRHAFGVFGVLFAVMLLFTCAYWTVAESKLTWIVGAHLTVQVLFTMAVHLKEVRSLSIACCGWRLSVTTLSPLVVVPLVYGGVMFEDGFRFAEDTYIRFLVFYGLVFPAYVLLFMGPLKRLPRTGRTLLLFASIVILSVPLYEAGFLHHRPWLLVIPLFVLLLVALARPRAVTGSADAASPLKENGGASR